MHRSLAIVAIAAAALALPLALRADPAPDAQAEPVVLVATHKAAGGWARSVVLSIPGGRGRHWGVLLNRPLSMRLEQIFPDFAPAKAVRGRVHFGGTESQNVVIALAELKAPPEKSRHVHANVYLLVDQEPIDRLITLEPNAGRYFMGWIAWRPGELAWEIEQGLWTVRRPSVDALLGEDPESLWERLRPRTTVQLEAR